MSSAFVDKDNVYKHRCDAFMSDSKSKSGKESEKIGAFLVCLGKIEFVKEKFALLIVYKLRNLY